MNAIVKNRATEAEEELARQLKGAGAANAADHFARSGLPTRRVEAYHYTDLKALLQDVPPPAHVAGTSPGVPFGPAGTHGIAISNGVPTVPAALPKGVKAWIGPGGLEGIGNDALAVLNQGLVQAHLGLEIVGNPEQVLYVDHWRGGDAAHTNSALRITVADGASATIVERFSGSAAAHLGNHASVITLGENASLTHIMVDQSDRSARHFATIDYDIGANCRLRSLIIHAGAALSRTSISANFGGSGTHGDFGGLNLAGEGTHHDISLDIVHAVAGTTSTELFKQVANQGGKAVFQGKITVARHAQKTDAKMMMAGLMLAEGAQILAKPELEIYADDVVCGHGSTCGDLDEEQLFYLMSRGIDRPGARAMLINAFLEELFDFLNEGDLHTWLSGVASDWVAGQ